MSLFSRLLSTLNLFIFITSASLAQSGQTGVISDPNIGFSFTVPEGWQAFNNQGTYMIASDYNKGLILVNADQYNSIQDLKNGLEGDNQGGGTFIQRSGNVNTISNRAMGANMSGQLEGTACTGYAIAFLTDAGKSGNILVLVEPQSYNNNYDELAKQVYLSISPLNGQTSNQYPQQTQNTNLPKKNSESLKGIGNAGNIFAGRKIAYIKVIGGYGSAGSRTKEVINFCPNGTFSVYSNDAMVVNGAYGGSAAQGGNGSASGQWQFNKRGGQYFLKLSINGETGEIPVNIFQDEYGDDRFSIDGRDFGYYGNAECY